VRHTAIPSKTYSMLLVAACDGDGDDAGTLPDLRELNDRSGWIW